MVDGLRELCPEAGELVIDGPELPIPPQMDGSRIERELGPLPRTSLEDGLGETVNRFRELHALLYGEQPYLYGVSIPNKFAASKRIRNLQTFAIEPGYSIRRWFLVDG